MKVKYTGTSDFQEFGAKDFAKADLEQHKLVFAKGEAVEVEDAVGEALTSKEGIFGDYSFEEATDDDSGVEEADSDNKSNPAMADSGTITEDTGPPASPPTGGRAKRASTRTATT